MPRVIPLPSRLTPRHLPRKRGRLKLQYKLGIQCRAPSRSNRFNGVMGGAGGPKGRNRNLPWPPCKKTIKKLVVLFLFVSLPQFRRAADDGPYSALYKLSVRTRGDGFPSPQPHKLPRSPAFGGFHMAEPYFTLRKQYFTALTRNFTARVSALTAPVPPSSVRP